MENANSQVTRTITPHLSYPAISVIIPMYNSEKYIGECLDSILAQTFQNFEVIVVDDCSTDSSPAIIEGYKEKFGGRLTLSSMEHNTGSGALPRNKGLSLSRGEYIFNMDNDDLITKTALEELYTLAKNFDADVVYCERYYESDPDGNNLALQIKPKGNLVDKPTFKTNNLAEKIIFFIKYKHRVEPWTKLVRRNLLVDNEIFFPHLKIADDDIWTYALLLYSERFLHVPNAVYIWRQTENSIYRSKKTPQKSIQFWSNPVILGLKTINDLLNRHNFFNKNPQYRYDILERFINKMFGFSFGDTFKLPSFAIYEAIKQEFGDKLGEYDVLISALCTVLNTQQKINAVNQQKFNQFAQAAQRRIAELEAEVKRLQT